jgi:precorrin-2 C(20)-methyltransferase
MKLYAIGVGPGAPDLVTVRAAEILRRVPVIFSPLSAMGTTSRALEVVASYLDRSRQRVVELAFPMQKDQEELESEWEEAVREITANLGPEEEGAFITIGDVSLYSTFYYVQRILQSRHPHILIELVPGISSFSAVSALLQIPYGIADDRIVILPATFERERLAQAIREHDTIILMKVNRVLDDVIDILEAQGIVDKAVFITKCGMPDQEVVYDVRTLRGTSPSYFSLILINKNSERSYTALEQAVSKPSAPRPLSRLTEAEKAAALSGNGEPPTPGGKLSLVGFGPGSHDHLTFRAKAAIDDAQTIIGYRTYVMLVKELIKGKEVFYTGMTEELARARRAVDMAWKGKRVALISSGDVGIYGMAGPALECLKERGWTRGCGLEVEVVPGVTALSASGALLGAPIVHDFCAISLSNLLTPWEVIVRRIEAAGAADYVIALYNPKSGRRTQQIVETRKILLKSRRPDTPVGIIKSANRDGQRVVITTLDEMLNHEIGMLTTILVGNSTTFVWEDMMVTPRGYQSKYTLQSLDEKVAGLVRGRLAEAAVGIDPFLGRKA